MKYVNRVTMVREPSTIVKRKLDSSRKMSEFVREIYLQQGNITVTESFYVIVMDNSLNVMEYSKISSGGVSSAIVDVKVVAKACIDTLGTHVALAHNHPSGKLVPSRIDIRLTERIKKGLDILGVELVDHIIITEDGYFSFADEGMLIN